MISYYKYMTCVLIALSILPQVFSIKCWECQSTYDPKCSDPMDNSTLPITDCSVRKGSILPEVPPNACRKIKQKVDGHWQYTRDCGYFEDIPGTGREVKFCYTKTGPDNTKIEICMCNNKDGCNSSNILCSPLTLFLAIVACLPYVTINILFY